MDIKSKYRAWVGEKHTDISNLLTNSDIETFAIEFAEWLVKNCSIPAVISQRELLLDFAEYSENDKTSTTLDECVDNYLDNIKQ